MFHLLRYAAPVAVLAIVAIYLFDPVVTLCVAVALLTYAYLPLGRARWVPAVAVVVVTLSPGFAFAATIDIGDAFSGGILDALLGAISAVIAALVAWVAMVIKNKFNVDIEKAHRDALTAFLQRQASSLVADGAVKLQGLKIEVSNAALAGVANTAIHAIPDAMKFFGLTPEALQKRIVDLLPQQPAVAKAQAVALDTLNPATASTGPAAPASPPV